MGNSLLCLKLIWDRRGREVSKINKENVIVIFKKSR